MEQSPCLPSKPSGSEQSVLLAFQALQSSWLRYWQDVSVFWESLMKCFASGNPNWMALKTSCIQTGLDRVLAGRLSELRQALEDLGIASNCTGCNELEVLSRTLLTLLSNAAPQSSQLKNMLNKASSPRKQQCPSRVQKPIPKREQVDQRPSQSKRPPAAQGPPGPSSPGSDPKDIRSERQGQRQKGTEQKEQKERPSALEVQPKRENCEVRQGLATERAMLVERQHVAPERGERRHSLVVPSVFSPLGSDFSREGNGWNSSLRQRSGSPIRQRVVQPNAAANLQNAQSRTLPVASNFEACSRQRLVSNVMPMQIYPTQVNPVSEWWQSDACVQATQVPSKPGQPVACMGGWGAGILVQR